MTSKSKKWRITKIANSARKNILAQDQESRKKVLHHLESLEINPFDRSIKKLPVRKTSTEEELGTTDTIFALQ